MEIKKEIIHEIPLVRQKKNQPNCASANIFVKNRVGR